VTKQKLDKHLINELRYLLSYHGWSVNRAAIYMGISESMLRHTLSGVRNPSRRTIEKLAYIVRKLALEK